MASPPPPPLRPRGRPDLVFRQLDDECVLYDPAARRMHVLNPAAAVVWLHCTGDATLAEIARALGEAFEDGGPAERLERDVAAAVTQFADRGLLE